MVSLVNAARYAAGKGGLGWINPAIYKYSSQFTNDIISGANKCVVGGSCCAAGFTATTGWDPVTGWGSVNFANFFSLFTSLGNQYRPSNNPTTQPLHLPSTPPSTHPASRPSIPTAHPTTRQSSAVIHKDVGIDRVPPDGGRFFPNI